MACNGCSEAIVSDRFLANKEIGWADILASHRAQTRQRMGTHAVVLCLQNTTELDSNGKQIDGLGPLYYEARRGMYLHPTYAVMPQREPLGVTDAWMWARDSDADTEERSAPKESTRWIKGYERVAGMADALTATRPVYVADWEGNLLELMLRAQALGTAADWLVRDTHNRCVPEGEKLWPHNSAGEGLGESALTMGSRHGQRAREVRRQLRAKRVEIPAGRFASVSVTCIVAREIGAPNGSNPVQWRLPTNPSAPSFADVVELIDRYRARREIAMFFHVVKNGCRVEALQLCCIEGIKLALALFVVLAWRIAHLMRTGCYCPDLDAELLFRPDEIQGAYLLMKKTRPGRAPRPNEIPRLIATLGGFLARKGDGEPIWLGLQRIMDAATTIQLHKTTRRYVVYNEMGYS